jgi:predicted CXXCH cytochrome family protein
VTRHSPTSAHGAGRRYAALATATVLGSLALAGVPGLASAQVTPSPQPGVTAASDAPTTPAPTDTTAPAPATTTPSATTDPTAPAASTSAPAPTASTSSPAPAAPVAQLPAAPAVGSNGSPRLAVGIQAYAAGDGGTSPHGPYTTTSDQCATCHRAHTAKNGALLAVAEPQSALCFTCHDGTGALSDVKAYYTDPLVPQNDPATSSYFRHDSVVASNHVLAEVNEFGGVSNRHAECSDCHNPHQASGTASASTPAGTPWTPSGRIAGTSGVSVTNGIPGTTPTYAWLDGVAAPVTAEYQLCLKCHSSFTVLPTNASGRPSRDATDVAKEFNPANNSFHPVEAPGKNATTKMANSLAGSSPFKLWTFTVNDTVRCGNCHATGTAVTTPAPAKGSSLAPHTSQYRGILLANYQDRVLQAQNDAYNANDFALCYLCHTDSPFNGSGSTSATAFSLHNFHVRGIDGEGDDPSTDIDKPGAGKGNAICSECHFRTHGTGATANMRSRMVEFSPNVQSWNGSLSWTHTATGGTCTLLCHGKDHEGETYASGAGG